MEKIIGDRDSLSLNSFKQKHGILEHASVFFLTKAVLRREPWHNIQNKRRN